MFSLMPDKAPVTHLSNLVKAQREQDEEDRLAREKQATEAAQKREAELHSDQEKQIEARYLFSLKSQVAALPAGTAPAAQAWYADDHDGFAQELFETARALAEEAVKAGKVIDVSAQAIASHLEKTKYGPRMARLTASQATQSPKTTPTPRVPAKTETTSLPEEPKVNQTHKLSEKEIIKRAAAAAFGIR